MYLLLNTDIFHCHVSLPEGIVVNKLLQDFVINQPVIVRFYHSFSKSSSHTLWVGVIFIHSRPAQACNPSRMTNYMFVGDPGSRVPGWGSTMENFAADLYNRIAGQVTWMAHWYWWVLYLYHICCTQILNVPASSKWSFDHPNGGHLTP